MSLIALLNTPCKSCECCLQESGLHLHTFTFLVLQASHPCLDFLWERRFRAPPSASTCIDPPAGCSTNAGTKGLWRNAMLEDILQRTRACAPGSVARIARNQEAEIRRCIRRLGKEQNLQATGFGGEVLLKSLASYGSAISFWKEKTLR